MGLIKIRKWQMFLVKMIVIPILLRIASSIEKKAKDTPDEWDDILANSFKAVIEALGSSDLIEET